MEFASQPRKFRNQNGRVAVAVLALCLAALISVAGCGSSSSGTKPPPTPTPGSNGLSIFPATASVPVGAQAVFIGYVPSQSNASITWAVTGGSANGSITSNSSGQGIYSAPASIPSPAQIAVTATSSGFSATAVVTITAAQGITVSPASASIPAGGQQSFAATGATGTVTWEVNGSPGGDGVHGTIDTNGNYTAPLTPPPGGSTVITALVGSASGTATATIVFSNATLNGAYSFAYTGDDSSGYLGVVGQFTADPASGSISGTEDVLSAAITPAPGVPMTGTYSVGPDGRGSVSISSSSQEVWQFALGSNLHGVVINFGQIATTGTATGSGTIDQQTPTPAPLAVGRYVFQLSGLDNGAPSGGVPVTMGIAGAFTSFGDGALAASGNTLDINDGGTVLSDDTSLTGTYTSSTLTLTATDFDTPGLAPANNALTFDYYVVSPTHLHLIETDGVALLTGDIFASPESTGAGYNATLLPKGNYAFTLGGATLVGPDAAGGVFTSNGGGSSTTGTSGNITGGEFDDNAPGSKSQTDATMSSTSYSVDQNLGRITTSITTPAGTANFVGYVTSAVDPTNPNSVQFLMLETDTNRIVSGTAYLQTSAAEPNGSYALNFTGVGNKSGTEQDVVAQANISSTSISGTMDINNFEVNGQQLGLNILTSKSTINSSADSDGRGTITFTAANGASFADTYYVVDANTVVMIETDNQRVMTGVWLKQF